VTLATWLADVLRDAGLTVFEVEGWKTRGRPYDFEPIGYVMRHHTASGRGSGNAPSLWTVTNGRSDLPGPLANLLTARNGWIYVVAAGYCNHAGAGGPYKTVPKDSGNKYFYGNECENDGAGEPWPGVQIDASRRAEAALIAYHHRDATWLEGHKEWAPLRKIDPFPTNMDDERAKVAALLTAPVAEEGGGLFMPHNAPSTDGFRTGFNNARLKSDADVYAQWLAAENEAIPKVDSDTSQNDMDRAAGEKEGILAVLMARQAKKALGLPD
jgi:hypothetical protein